MAIISWLINVILQLLISAISCDAKIYKKGPSEIAKALDITESRGGLGRNQYLPSSTICPSKSLVRAANQYLNDNESAYVEGRMSKTAKAHKDFLARMDLFDEHEFDLDEFYDNLSKPYIAGLAISGGGYRSMFTAAGVLSAFDYRTPGSTNGSHLGGILQSSMYISGVSGGSWLVSSLLMNGFQPIHELWLKTATEDFVSPLLEGIPDFDFDSKKEAFGNSKKGEKFAKRDFLDEIGVLEDGSEELEKRQLRGNIRTRVQQFISELDNAGSDLSSYSSDRLRRILERLRMVPSSARSATITTASPTSAVSTIIGSTTSNKTTSSTSAISTVKSTITRTKTVLTTVTDGPDDVSTSDEIDPDCPETKRFWSNTSSLAPSDTKTQITMTSTKNSSDLDTCTEICTASMNSSSSIIYGNKTSCIDSDTSSTATATDDLCDEESITATLTGDFCDEESVAAPQNLIQSTLLMEARTESLVKKAKIKNSGPWTKISKFYQELHYEVRMKKLAGFPITFTDYWARALAKKLYPVETAEKNVSATLSGIFSAKYAKTYDVPFPIILSDSRWPDTSSCSKNSQVFEFTPFEFGSWDYYLNAFVQIKYLGSALYNGIPVFSDQKNNSLCVTGFDDVAFITASSSSLFNNVLIYIWQAVSLAKRRTSNALKIILYTFGLNISSERRAKNHPDYALLAPNPFYGFSSSNAEEDIVNSPHLFMVDGGEDKQNVPFHPFLQEARNVDIIFAVDSTSDKKNFPNGTSLKATFERYTENAKFFNMSTAVYPHGVNSSLFSHGVFPKVPTSLELVSQNISSKPSFFGCDLNKYPSRRESTFNTKGQYDYYNSSRLWLPPLIVYLPNSQYSFHSNMSTFKLSYSSKEVEGMVDNGYNIATYGNFTQVPYYGKCIACATLKREFDRIERGMNKDISANDFMVPKICEQCFEQFCYS